MPEECHQDAQGCGLDRSDSVNSTNFVVNIMYRLMVYRLIFFFFKFLEISSRKDTGLDFIKLVSAWCFVL